MEMTLKELKTKLDEVAGQIGALELSEREAYAELGRRLYPELAEDEQADLVLRIKTADEELAGLRKEQTAIETEYSQRVAAATCFYCKTVNAEGAAFCEECGKKLGEKPKEYCEACGMMNRPGQKFCGECGKKLEG